MLSVSQSWLVNQKKQVRSESDVRITIYSDNFFSEESKLLTLTKKDLKNFSYIRSGSIINKEVPFFEAKIKLLKVGNNWDFDVGNYAKIEFGYKLDFPEEYQRVEYIEATGTQWIDTGLLSKDNITKIEAKTYRETIDANQILFGMYNGTNICYFEYLESNDVLGLKWLNSNKINPSLSVWASIYIRNICFTNIDGQLSYKVNDCKTAIGTTTTTPTGNSHYYLFACNSQGNAIYQSKCRLYSFRVYKDFELVRDFVPCYRKSDNVIGLYDLVSKTFFTNQGTGTFNKGVNVNADWEYIEVCKCQTKDKINKQNGIEVEYIFDFLGYKKLNENYIGGSASSYPDANYTIQDISIHKTYRIPSIMEKMNIYPFNYSISVGYIPIVVGESYLPNKEMGYGLQTDKKINVVQRIASACGKTFDIQTINSLYIPSLPLAMTGYREIVNYLDISHSIKHTDYEINPNNSLKFPEFEYEKQFGSFTIKQYSKQMGTNSSSYSLHITGSDVFKYYELSQLCFPQLVYLQNTQSGNSYYAYCYGNCIGTLENDTVPSGDYTVNLYGLNLISSKIEYVIDSNIANVANFDNELVNSNFISFTKDLINTWINENLVIDCDFRIDPRLELYDQVKVVDKSGNVHYGVVEEFQINFNGCFKGKARIRKITPPPTPETIIVHKTIDIADFNSGKECVIENMSSLDVFLNMQTNNANGMIWKRRNRQTLEIIDEWEKDCGRVAIGQKKDPDTKEVLGNYVGVYEHTISSQYKLLEPNPISTEFNSGDEIWTITLKVGYSLHFSRSGYERYLLDNFSGYIDYQ